MYYYVYQITNLINGKIYVGKHKSVKHPNSNGYFGSGKQITDAIKKYGKENFRKEVLFFCSSLEEMSIKESEIVDIDFVKRSDTYNMHKGGAGGWDHINCVPNNSRINIKAIKEKIKAGLLHVGGTKYWSKSTFDKVRETRWSVLVAKGIVTPNNWINLTLEERCRVSAKISEKVSGLNNGAFGTHIYVDPLTDTLPASNILNKNRFIEGKQPSGWITVSEWKDRRKNKKNNAYGRKWYNDGKKIIIYIQQITR